MIRWYCVASVGSNAIKRASLGCSHFYFERGISMKNPIQIICEEKGVSITELAIITGTQRAWIQQLIKGVGPTF